MQADHIAPVTRLINDVGGNPLPASEQRMMNPERNVVGNMMPACPQCNNSKGGYSLEGWRDLLKRSAEIVAREKPIFRAGVRMGVISVSAEPVVFHFEKVAT
jgi:5-methylcytosine-specific restriction endonuclease McrA